MARPRSRTLRDWQDGQARGDDDERPDGSAAPEPTVILRAPCKARVVLTCPDCQADVAVDASLFARRTRDSDGTTTLALRTRAAKVAHSCDQLTLDAAASGPLVR